MRFRISLVACSAAAVLIWAGCNDTLTHPGPSSRTGVAFAVGGGSQCDTHGAPVRDYFTEKTDRQQVGALFHDLAQGCADGDASVTLDAGFAILEKVESAREARTTGLPDDGAEVVAVAWNIMVPFLGCDASNNCVAQPIPSEAVSLEDVAAALDLQGAFGVRATSPDPVISYGNASVATSVRVPYWGIEPFCELPECPENWSDVLPVGRALVLGYPNPAATGIAGEESLGPPVAYEWSVLPWYGQADDSHALSVTICKSSDTLKEKVAHGGELLQEGQDSWCAGFVPSENDPLYAQGVGSSLEHLAASLLPLWPRPLRALLTGVSGSGKARSFSPYFGYAVDPDGLITFIQPPADASVNGLICAAGANVSESAESCPAGYGIQVQLTTQKGSLLSGSSSVMLVMTAEDNNGSWTLLGNRIGTRVDLGSAYGLVYEWNDLRLDKAGAYKLHIYRTDAEGCVFDDDGAPVLDANGDQLCDANTIGLAFPATSSEKFLENP